MKKHILKIFFNEDGQSTTEYMVLLVFMVVLSFIGFLIVPHFAEGFDHVLNRILDGNYDQTFALRP